jgi:penicillin-binding protein 1A
MLYGLAVEELSMNASSPVENGAQFFPGHTWYPANYGNKGGTTLATGLAYSYNGVASYLLKKVGINKFKTKLNENYGITSKLNAYPSLCLGADEIPMIQLLRAYTMFPGIGTNTEPYYISKIEDRNGNLLKSFMPERKDVMSEASAYKMTQIMEGPVTKGTAKGLKAGLGLKAMGGKTGTTNDNSDLWFVGYTPQLLAGVWVGCDDRFIRSQNGNAYQGGKAAAPIWKYFFKRVLNDKTLGIRKDMAFQKPASMNAEIISDFETQIDSYDVERVTVGGGVTTSKDEVDLSKEYEDPEGNNNLGPESEYENKEQDPKPPIPDTTKGKITVAINKETQLLKLPKKIK